MKQLTEAPTGLELIQAIFDRRLPPPGVATLLGMDGLDAEEGRVSFTLEPNHTHTNPYGTVHGGILATLLDSAMTCAVQSVLPFGALPTTVELSVRYVKPVPPDGRRLRTEGTVIHVGTRLGTAEGRVTDDDGALYATGTTTCMILREPR